MTKKSFSETSSTFVAQQSTIDEVSKALRDACSELQNRKRELKLLEPTEEFAGLLAIISVRLDVLEAIEAKLLIPIKNEYAFIERSAGNHQPWEVCALKDRRQFVFLDSIMKGL